MISEISLSDMESTFLSLLIQNTHENNTPHVSMYDIGTHMGLDKSTTLKTAEALMGLFLVEVKSLSGNIAPTDKGVELFSGHKKAGDSFHHHRLLDHTILLDHAILNVNDSEATSDLIQFLESSLEKSKMDDALKKGMRIDLQTLQVQLTSPYPKMVIVRCILSALKKDLTSAGLTRESVITDTFLSG